MSLTNYSDLQTSIASWLKRDDLTANIPDFIALCEVTLARKLIAMNPPPAGEETTQTGNLAVPANAPALLAFPTGYLSTKRFQIKEGGNYRDLTYKTPDQMAKYEYGDEPYYFTTNGNNLEIGAPPDDTYAYSWVYYQAFTPLSNNNATNWLMTANPDLYLWGSLLMAEPFMKNDKRIPVWAGLYANALNDFELANRKNRQGGSTLQVRSDVAF